MSWDIHSYFETRDGPGAPWVLVQRAAIDPESGLYDVPIEKQPLGFVRSSSFFAVLTGIIAMRAGIDYGRLRPIVPEGRPPAADLGDELRRIYRGWEGSGTSSPFWLTLADLEAEDWDRPVYDEDGRPQPLENFAGLAQSLIPRMRRLARGRGPDDVRLVFWLDS